MDMNPKNGTESKFVFGVWFDLTEIINAMLIY